MTLDHHLQVPLVPLFLAHSCAFDLIDNKKKERKKKKDRSNDVDSGMQNLGYSASQASSYQAGSYGAAPNAAPNPFAGNGVGENAPFAQGNLQSGPQSR